jgi:hypothetical protein
MHYKFLDSVHVPRVMVDGTIIISSFDYFRRLEASAWDGIADNLEAATEFGLPDNFVVTADSPELAQINDAGIGLGMCAQFARVESGGQLVLSGARFIHQTPDAFIFSASWGVLDSLRKYMCEDAPRPYSACLKIRSLHRLESCIFQEGYIRELDCQFSDVFERGQRGIVSYEVRSNSLPEAVLPPSAFKKGLRFKDQSEARITFVPKVAMPHLRLTIQVPNPSALFEPLF